METRRSTKHRVSTFLYTILMCSCFYSMIIAELEVSCQPGWNVSAHSGTCVMLSHDEKTWAMAREDCKKHKADLVKIIGGAMNNFITDLVKTESNPVFIGLQTDKDNSRIFNWITDSSQAGYLNWAQSKLRSSERCVRIETRGDARGKWNRVDCNEKLKYLCERTSGPQSSLAPALCHPGWIISATSGTCIKKYYTRKTWKEARDQCKSDKGDLVMIPDDTMKTLVSDQVSTHVDKKFWIGLSDHQKQDEFRWLDNGEKVNSSKWFVAGTSCALINYQGRDQWTKRDCDSKHSFICEKATDEGRWRSLFITRPSTQKCYSPFPDLYNWDDARRTCYSFKSDLVTIADNATNQFVWGQLSLNKEQSYWIGLSDRKQEGKFHWLDEDKEATYTNWFKDQQTDARIQRCIAVGNKWSPHDCSLSLPFICETFSYGIPLQETNCEDGACHSKKRRCDKDGTCSEGCPKGYWGDKCDKECETGKYGRSCEETCNTTCAGSDNQCNNIDGTCINGCDSGYKGKLCEKACDNHTYGLNCSQSCSPNCKEDACDKVHGMCLHGCDEGYKGDECNEERPNAEDKRRKGNKKSPQDPSQALYVGVGVALIVIAFIVTAVAVVIMRNRSESNVLSSLPE